ncbi:unnamed protein product [Trypanosoma congolense IL3000]|uniref:WGS project CAEQ00000000 data, annotated contig 98 n=1 Tax=Trypanosoma congolense (strain IL3000) TaxID=1068625 RepID=F9WK54_TRYCI|nr:unnamed protein product [Trypanosoma congolense IL3000]
MKIWKRTGDVPLGPDLDALLRSVPNETRCDTLRRLWRVMGHCKASFAEILRDRPQEEWVRVSCRILFYLWLPQWSAGDFVDGRWVGMEAQRWNDAMESFLRYAEENVLLRVTWCLIEEVNDIREGKRKREMLGSDASLYRRKSTPADFMLLLEALDGLEQRYLNGGSGSKPLVEWVAMAQRAKLEQLFDTCIERHLTQHATQHHRSTIKQQLLHWMMELDEPDYVRFWEFMESLNSEHFGGVESEGPLQTLLDVNHYILSAKDKLDFVGKFEPEEWTEELRRREEEHEDFCNADLMHEWTWNELREMDFCDEHTLDLAEDVEGLLRTQLPADALSNFKKQYRRHQACNGDKIKVKRQEKNVLESEEELCKVLRVICRTLKSVKGYESLRRTQLVAIVTLVRGSTVLNVETGEGKTDISGCCAAFKAYCGYRVDVVTSSETLAKQSKAGLDNFLKELFGEDMCHVLSGDSSNGYDKPVVFGTFNQFIASDLAYTNCGAKSNADLEKRKSSLRYLLVDEADQPLLNEFARVVYIKSPWLPGRRVTPGLVNLMEQVQAQQVDPDTLKQAYQSGVDDVCKTKKDEAKSQPRLRRYVKSARLASKGLREGVDYVAAEGVIGVPYNADTGELQRGMTWQDGLSTFVSLKNGGLWNDEGLSPVFCAYFTFLASYRGAMGGMTGTVGCWRSRRVLEEVYGLRVKSIPRAFRRRFSLEKPVALKTENQRDDAVITEAVRRAEGGQPVLLLMQYHSEAEVVFEKIQERLLNMDPNNQPKVVLYLDDGKHHNTPDIENATGNIIVVSTALAGRGKDFTLNNRQNKQGGLFVILGYGATQREMTQAYGRAARQTDRGGAVSMVFHETGDYYQALNEVTFGEKLRLQKIQSEDARKMDLEKHLRDVYLEIVKKTVDDNTEFAHKLKLCEGVVLCECLRYDNPYDPRNCRKLANFLAKIMETRFGLWMNEHRDKLFKASRSVQKSEALLETMRRGVLDEFQGLSRERQPNILGFLRTSDEALEFCLSVCRVEALSKLWDKPESKLQSFGKTCTFGTIPYYVGYSYLKRAQENEKQQKEFFEKAADCFCDSANSFERWAQVYEHVDEVADRIHPGPERSEAFTDRCEIMRQHHRIASCLAGTRNWNPTMFVAAFQGIKASPLNAEKAFRMLLKDQLLTPARLKLKSKDVLKEKLQNLGVEKAAVKGRSNENLSRLAGALICEGNSEYGLGLYDAVVKEAKELVRQDGRADDLNHPAEENDQRAEKMRDELWKKLTDPIKGVIQPFCVAREIRHASNDNLTKKIEDALAEPDENLDEKFIPLAMDVFMNSIGILRTEQFPNFEVKMGRLTDAFKAYGLVGSACVSRQLEYFRPLGQHEAVVFTRHETLGEWFKSWFTTWKVRKSLISYAAMLVKPVLCAVVNLVIALVDFGKKACEAACEWTKIGWEIFSWGNIQRAWGSAIISFSTLCRSGVDLYEAMQKAISLLKAVREAIKKIADEIEAHADRGGSKIAIAFLHLLEFALWYMGEESASSVTEGAATFVASCFLSEVKDHWEDSVQTTASSAILELCKKGVSDLSETFQEHFLERLRPALYRLYCQDKSKFEQFKGCVAKEFNELTRLTDRIFSDLLHDVLSICQHTDIKTMSKVLGTSEGAKTIGEKRWGVCSFREEFESRCDKALYDLKKVASRAEDVKWNEDIEESDPKAKRKVSQALHDYKRRLEIHMQHKADGIAHVGLRLFNETLREDERR